MEIEIATIGGYEEVGRQMTAVRAGDDVVVFDMGLNLSKVLIHDNVETERMHSLDLDVVVDQYLREVEAHVEDDDIVARTDGSHLTPNLFVSANRCDFDFHSITPRR